MNLHTRLYVLYTVYGNTLQYINIKKINLFEILFKNSVRSEKNQLMLISFNKIYNLKYIIIIGKLWH